jgi:GT2 family glycosyltransferase
MRAHIHALRLDPAAYVQAATSRLRGLRLRSRQQFAILLGRTDAAYDLWVERHSVRNEGGGRVLSEVWCVVDCRVGGDGLSATLASIASAGWQAVVMGEQAVAEVPRIAGPHALADFARNRAVHWLCAMLPGDRISARAPLVYATAASGSATLLYADDDLSDNRGNRRRPHFKPDWNPELFAHHDFLTGACLVAVEPRDLQALSEDGWVEALIAGHLEAGAVPVHVPEILHHRRERPAPQVPTGPTRFSEGKQPLVTLIVPTRNQPALLKTCLEGVTRTSYPRIELVVIDNGSDEPAALELLEQAEGRGATVLCNPGPFNFSALNNRAVGPSRGDLLCFLNNDVEVMAPDWLEALAVQAVRDDLGAVGAKLLYPDGTIQHAGVVVGLNGAAGHAHRGEPADATGYFARTQLPQRVTAVTAACMVVSRDKFLAVGGFDEEAFPVAFNDVDLCLRLNERGWQSFYEPRATLIHHESKSRGLDRDPAGRERLARETKALQARWKTDRFRDPFHHPLLSSHATSFVVDL